MNQILTHKSIASALERIDTNVLPKYPESDIRHGVFLGVAAGLELAGQLLNSAYEDEHNALVKNLIDRLSNA